MARNPERMKELNNRFYEKNPSYRNSYQRSRLEKDLNFKLGKVLHSRLNSALKNNQKVGSAIHDLGCSISELRTHLESKWQPGMTWENWSLHGWHIDHIIPLLFFDLSDLEQVKKACHYTNLKPMWAKDNRVKKNKCESSSK